MADCNDLFLTYNGTIKLDDGKRELLRTVRDELRGRMLNRYNGIKGDIEIPHELEFQSQGSYVMDTIITPKDDDFDLDDGVYFIGGLPEDKRPSIKNFHDWVLYAVGEDETYGTVSDKDTCVRVLYKKEKFHIDLPIYYTENYECPELAHKKDGWIQSNPVEFIAWFEDKIQSGFKKGYLLESKMFSEYQEWLTDIRKNDSQLRRIVRYLKAWADDLRGEMPPGIVMTILAAENYVSDDRDDVALFETLKAIRVYLNENNFQCIRPTTPAGENLFESYSQTKKDYFSDRLDSFTNSARQALELDNPKEACLKWQRHLGYRFPCHLAKDEVEGAETHVNRPILGSTAKSA